MFIICLHNNYGCISKITCMNITINLSDHLPCWFKSVLLGENITYEENDTFRVNVRNAHEESCTANLNSSFPI